MLTMTLRDTLSSRGVANFINIFLSAYLHIFSSFPLLCRYANLQFTVGVICVIGLSPCQPDLTLRVLYHDQSHHHANSSIAFIIVMKVRDPVIKEFTTSVQNFGCPCTRDYQRNCRTTKNTDAVVRGQPNL